MVWRLTKHVVDRVWYDADPSCLGNMIILKDFFGKQGNRKNSVRRLSDKRQHDTIDEAVSHRIAFGHYHRLSAMDHCNFPRMHNRVIIREGDQNTVSGDDR